MLQLFRNHPAPTSSSSSSSSSSLFTSIFGYSTNHAKENNDILSLTLAGNHKVGFEDILYIIKQYQKCTKNLRPSTLHHHHCHRTYWLVNTLPANQQDVLISHTIPYHGEEDMFNDVLNDLSKKPHEYFIVIYGKNNTDDTVDKKYKQLIDFGFTNVFVYYGGLFEWTLLQDVYGSEHFPTTTTTTTTTNDLLYWGPSSKFMG